MVESLERLAWVLDKKGLINLDDGSVNYRVFLDKASEGKYFLLVKRSDSRRIRKIPLSQAQVKNHRKDYIKEFNVADEEYAQKKAENGRRMKKGFKWLVGCSIAASGIIATGLKIHSHLEYMKTPEYAAEVKAERAADEAKRVAEELERAPVSGKVLKMDYSDGGTERLSDDVAKMLVEDDNGRGRFLYIFEGEAAQEANFTMSEGDTVKNLPVNCRANPAWRSAWDYPEIKKL